MVHTALAFGRGLHVLVNNAGVEQSPLARVADLDLESWDRVLAVNLTGPFLMMKAAIPHMVEAGGGSIINVSSLAGLVSPPKMPAYVASKGGLISLSKQVAVDYGVQNVRCNVVCPGATKTDMMVSAFTPFAAACGLQVDDVIRQFSKDIPMKRVCTPAEMAGLCSFLASDDASFLTAAVIPVDGGAVTVDVSGSAINELAARHGSGRKRRGGVTVAVTVKIVGDLNRFVQARSLELKGARYTLGSAVEELVRRNPRLGEQLFDREGRLHYATVLALDGRAAGWPQDRDTVIGDGVELMLTRFHSGG